MQQIFRPAILAMPRAERDQVRATLNLKGINLWQSLRPYDQATVVLALLQRNKIPPAERLIGKQIVVCPPSRRLHPLPHPASLPSKDRIIDPRVITKVVRNPRLPTTPAFQRFKVFVVGRTIGECYRRGLKRRDVLLALRKKWITVKEPRQ